MNQLRRLRIAFVRLVPIGTASRQSVTNSTRWRAGRRYVAVVITAFAALLGVTTPAAAKVMPGTESGATVTKTGWWWKTNDDSEAPPELGPVTDAVPPPPPPKNVPEDTLPVAAYGGEPNKVSALEFDFDAEPGAQVSSFVLSLRESEHPGANVAADSPETKVVACKVTETFWTSGEAATWQAKPDYDDSGCQQGKRDGKGVWTFDLTSFAAEWLGTEQRSTGSVVLVEEVDEPVSFQVVYDGPAKDGVGTSFESTPGSGSDGVAGGGTSGEADVEVSSGTAGAGPVPGASGGVPAGSSVGMDAAPPQAAAQAPASAQAAPQSPQPQAADRPFVIAPSAVEDVPAGVWVLAPLMLGIAYLMMLALGPSGEPNALVARRGVSKALERLRSTGTKTAGGMR